MKTEREMNNMTATHVEHYQMNIRVNIECMTKKKKSSAEIYIQKL